jgi:PKD repeat protein
MRRRLAIALVLSAATVDGCSCELPTPNLHVSPGSTVLVGQTVTFDSNTQAGDPPDHISADAQVSWDLDGDGSFEHSGDRVVKRRFDTPGHYAVTFAVRENVYNGGIQAAVPVDGYATRAITVNPAAGPQPPEASFSASPNPGYTERDIGFDASASNDPDGQIVKYEWDWTADGAYDVAAASATASHAYEFAGSYTVRLRVTDDSGATGVSETTVQVVDGVPPGKVIGAASPGISAAAGGSPFTIALGRVRFTRGTTTVAGAKLLTAGIRAHGRARFTRLPALLGTHRSPRYAANLALVQRGNGRAAKLSGQGYILLSFTRRDSLCLAGTASGGVSAPFHGKLAAAGGKGLGAHARGTGTFAPPKLQKGKPVLTGRLKLRRVHKPRGLPKACRKLVPDLPR